MSDVLGLAASEILPDSSSASIGEWDSVRHLQLMLAVEEEFGVQLEADELISLTSVPLIEARLRATTA